jgi:hypothetical protein
VIGHCLFFAEAAAQADGASALKLRVRLDKPLYRELRLTPGCFVGLVADYYAGQA